jgi:hypothetical protein
MKPQADGTTSVQIAAAGVTFKLGRHLVNHKFPHTTGISSAFWCAQLPWYGVITVCTLAVSFANNDICDGLGSRY